MEEQIMNEHNSLVATFASRKVAGEIVRKLQKSGLDLARLSIVSKDQDRIAHEVEGATVIGGLDELGFAQSSCIPRESLRDYEAELKVGRVIAFVHGSAEDIAKAKSVVDLAHPDGWDGKVGCAVYYGCFD
jgi:nucleoside diphosphate kinase